MTFGKAIDEFISDYRIAGRINSPTTERSYRSILASHIEDVGHDTDPVTVTRENVKTTLRRWPRPNTQRVARSILVSFYDWMMEEGHRPDNPARQTRRPKKQPTTVYRLTRAEAAAMIAACTTTRERRAITLGICAGLRNAELRGLQGRHFQRPGFVWVSADIAKGQRERWVPVGPDLEPVAREIRENVAPDAYVLPAVRWRDPGANTRRGNLELRGSSSQALRTLVIEVAKRAGIAAHIHPHLLRHAYGDHIAKHAGIKNAQALMGHADIGTTADTYTGKPTLDELTAAVQGFSYGAHTDSLLENPVEAPTGIEPVDSASQAVDRDAVYIQPDLEGWLAPLAPRIGVYVEAFA